MIFNDHTRLLNYKNHSTARFTHRASRITISNPINFQARNFPQEVCQIPKDKHCLIYIRRALHSYSKLVKVHLNYGKANWRELKLKGMEDNS